MILVGYCGSDTTASATHGLSSDGQHGRLPLFYSVSQKELKYIQIYLFTAHTNYNRLNYVDTEPD